MNLIKLIAIDLDDTLLHDDISLSEYTRDTLRKAMQKGVRIVIATGRMFQAARPWGQAIGLGDVPMICYTGSLTGLCESGRSSVMYGSSGRRRLPFLRPSGSMAGTRRRISMMRSMWRIAMNGRMSMSVSAV